MATAATNVVRLMKCCLFMILSIPSPNRAVSDKCARNSVKKPSYGSIAELCECTSYSRFWMPCRGYYLIIRDFLEAEGKMFKAETYRVLIASQSDLLEERKAAMQAVNDWNTQHAANESIVLLPIWEMHAIPQSGIRPQEAINQQLLNRCDLLVGMFWRRLGTNTGVAESGTVEEINQFIAVDKPAMLYFSSRPIDLVLTADHPFSLSSLATFLSASSPLFAASHP
jgi:hypothetical protein